MKKKLLLGLLTLASVTACSIGFTACEHKHTYSEDWSKDEANHWHDCTGEDCSEKDGLAAHTYGAPEVVVAATCYSEGEQKLTCTVCGSSKTETIAKVSHNWSTEWDYSADKHFHVCLNDGCTATTGDADHGAWKDGKVLTKATCTEKGEQQIICEVCGYESEKEIPATGHGEESYKVTTPAGCTTAGVGSFCCTVCGDEIRTEVIPAKGHSAGEYEITKEADCTHDGVKTATCSACGEEFTEAIPALGHIPTAYTVTKQSTCHEEGERTSTCERCKEEFTEAIPKLNHQWGTWKVVNEGALCTEENERERECSLCGDKQTEVVPAGEHLFDGWTVTEEPTCEEAGSRTHSCVNCSFSEDEVMPALGHRYTQWYIEELPTEEKAGSAIMYCEGDHAHDVTVTLPKIADNVEGYVYDSATGYYNCTVKHANGDVKFSVYKVISVANAVDVAVKTQNQVISADVTRNNIMITQNGANPSKSDIKFELGYNYVHINDTSEANEHFYTLNDDDTIFAVLKRRIGGSQENPDDDVELIEKDTEATLEAFNGFGYSFTFMTGGTKYYGTGGMINYLYTLGKINTNKDFNEFTKVVNGETYYCFTYGYVYGKYFDVISVEFKFDKKFIVADATLQVKTYVTSESEADPYITLEDPKLLRGEDNHWYYDGRLLIESAETDQNTGVTTYVYAEMKDGAVFAPSYVDEDGTPRMRVKYTASYMTLPDGTLRLIDGMEDKWANCETFTVKQKTVLDKGENLPTNPYKLEDFIISSFDLQYGDRILDKDETLTINATDSVVINVINVLPSTYNPYFDEFNVVLVDAFDNEQPAINIIDVKDGQIGYYFFTGNDGTSIDKNYNITLKSFIAGEWTLKILTMKNEFTVNLVVDYIAPSTLYAEVQQFNDFTEKSTWSKSVSSIKVYQNQAVTFRSAVDHPYYESSEYTVSATLDGVNVTAATVKEGAIDGIPVSIFSASEIGTYTVTIASALNPAQTSTLTITVKEAPNVSEMLTGDFSNDDKGFAVEIIPEDEGLLNGIAIIKNGFDNPYETTISYVYDEQTGKFTCEYVDGAEGENVQGTLLPFNYGLELSDSYKLYLTYESGFDGSTKRVIIGGFDNALECENSLITAKAQTTASKLIANVSGRYLITAATYTFIAVNGEQIKPSETLNYLTPSTPLELTLYIGDYIQLWNGISSAPTYTIEVLEVFSTVYVTGIEFAEQSVKVKEGEKITLEPVYTPEDTTQKGLTWSVSNPGIATVDENGVVTGVIEGTVTVTATTSNGKYSASIEVKVIGANVLELGKNTIMGTSPFWDKTYTFTGEADKTYSVSIETDWGNGNVTYNGIAYNYAYYNGTATSFNATADSEGIVTLKISQYGYGETNVFVTIEKYDAPTEPEPNYEEIKEGQTTLTDRFGSPNFTIVGDPNTQYEVTTDSSISKYPFTADGEIDYENFTTGALTLTTDENGFVDFQLYLGGSGATVVVTITKVGGSIEPNHDALKVGDTTIDVYPGYIYYTVVGEANTRYDVTSDLTVTKYFVVNGTVSYDVFTSGTLTVTTDENGFVDICLYPSNGPGEYVITVTKAVGSETPDPDPEPAQPVLTTDGLTLETLSENGVTLLLDEKDFVIGHSYKISSTADITFIAGIMQQGNPLTFIYDNSTLSVSVSCSQALTNVVIAVEDLGELTEEIEAEEITLDQLVNVTDAGYIEDFSSEAKYYKIELAETATYKIQTNDAKVGVGELEDGMVIAVLTESDQNGVELEAGTYYIEVFAANENDSDVSFTIVKVENVLKVGESLTVSSVNSMPGISISLGNCEFGEAYRVYTEDNSLEFSTDMWNYKTDLSFVFSSTMRYIYVRSASEEVVATAVIKLEETTIEEQGGEAITLGQEVTATDVDWYNPPVYTIELTAGTYNIYVNGEKLESIDATSAAMLGYVEFEDEPSPDTIVPFETTDGNIEITEDGTYYLLICEDSTVKVVAAE